MKLSTSFGGVFMLKTSKKILSVIMVVIMVLTAVPLSSFVGLELPAFDLGIRASAADELASTGQCGENVYWNYDSATGELVISGEGAMYDYDTWNDNQSPFYSSDIKSIIIEDGVTSIGSHAFYECNNLISIIFSDSLVSIGYDAFYRCTSLSSIALPGSVTLIGSNAFEGCTSLTSITIPDSVTSIGFGAFEYCTSLTNITIPDNVVEIGGHTFYNTAYYKNSENWENDIFYIGKHLLDAKETLAGVYEVKEGTLTIAEYAFSYCDELTNVIIPESVKTIGEDAFKSCESLENVILSEGLMTIGGYAFGYCKSLISIIIPDSVTNIGHYAFKGCESLATVSIGKNINSIGDSIFEACPNIIEATIAMKEIPSELFIYKNNLKKVSLKEGVEKIYDEAFANCTYLETINFPNSLKYMGKNILMNTAWFNYKAKGVIVYDNWLYGFKGDETNITIPVSKYIRGIAYRMFSGDKNIVAFNVDEANPYLSSENGILFNKEKTSLMVYPCGKSELSYAIPDTVEEIMPQAFYQSKITSVVIPDSVITIGENAFYNSNVININLGSNIKNIGSSAFYCSRWEDETGKHVYIKDIEAWCEIDFANGAANPLYIYDDEIERQGPAYLYVNDDKISSVDKLDKITKIKPFAFYNCDNLTNIDLSGIDTVGRYAFYDCNRLKRIDITDNITSMGDYAFKNCHNLKNVTFGKGLELISNYAFDGCYNLERLFIPDNITKVGDGSFRNCSALSVVTLSETIQEIGSSSFPSNIKDVYYPGSQEDWERISGIWYLGYENLYLMHSHDYTITTQKQVSCTEGGIIVYTCKLGDTITEIIPPLGHNWIDKGGSVKVTCTTDGIENYICSNCGEEKYNITYAVGHDWYDMGGSVDATCTESGLANVKCSVCYEENKIIIPAYGHSLRTITSKKSTCTTDGERKTICTECNLTETEVIPAKGHSYFDEWNTLIPANCVESGIKARACMSCGYIESQVVSKLGHSDLDNDGFCDFCKFGEAIKPDIPEDPSENCSCNCHKGGISGFIFKLILFFQRLLGSNKTCDCGASHY